MVIKKIYEIEEKSCGNVINFIRCTEIKIVSRVEENGFYNIFDYGKYFSDAGEFLICKEGETSYSLIDEKANIIHENIRKEIDIDRVKKTSLFRCYFLKDNLVSIGSIIDKKVNNLTVNTRCYDILPIRDNWIELEKNNGYYKEGLLVINYELRFGEYYLYIYCAKSLDLANKIKIFNKKVIARLESIQNTRCIRIIILDENSFPYEEYFVSVDDGKMMQPEMKII